MILSQAVNFYLENNSVRTSTARDYRAVLNNHAKDILGCELADISREVVFNLYVKTRERSQAQAIKLKTYLNAIFAFVIEIENLPMRNPVSYTKRLTRGKEHVLEPRKTMLKETTLPVFISELNRLQVKERSFYLLLLYTGCRVNEIAQLEWREIDWEAGTIDISGKKRKNGQALHLVLSSIPMDILRKLYIRARSPNENGQVFAGVNKRSHVSIQLYTGINCKPHDLRRTFASVAGGLDIPDMITKKLVGHALSDITARYINLLDSDAREYNRRIVERINEFAQLSPSVPMSA